LETNGKCPTARTNLSGMWRGHRVETHAKADSAASLFSCCEPSEPATNWGFRPIPTLAPLRSTDYPPWSSPIDSFHEPLRGCCAAEFLPLILQVGLELLVSVFAVLGRCCSKQSNTKVPLTSISLLKPHNISFPRHRRQSARSPRYLCLLQTYLQKSSQRSSQTMDSK
jgi:hypothetical protein